MAYTGNSIVDYLNSTGGKSDYNSRAALAKEKGISNYTGSAGQNTTLLNMLRGSSSQPSSPTITAPGAQTSSFDETLRRAQEISNNSIQPLISSLQASNESVKQQYDVQNKALEAQRQPLKERYDQLLSQVKGQQTQSVNKQTLATSNELGKRGILPSSGLNQQEIINATEPINQQYTALANDVGFQGQQAQQEITNQQANLSASQIKDLREISNAIAQAQAGGNQSAISLALEQIRNQQDQSQQAFQNSLAEQQLALSRAGQGISQRQAEADLKLKEAQLKQLDPAYIKSLYEQLGIGTNTAKQNINPLLLGGDQQGSSAKLRPSLDSFIK